VPVAFGGSAPAIQSVLGGHTPIGFIVLTPAVPQVKEGLLRAPAVTTPKSSAALPDVSTLTKSGLSEQEADTIPGILVPAATPEHIVALLYREIGSAMEQTDAADKLAALGFSARRRISLLGFGSIFRSGPRSSGPHVSNLNDVWGVAVPLMQPGSAVTVHAHSSARRPLAT